MWDLIFFSISQPKNKLLVIKRIFPTSNNFFVYGQKCKVWKYKNPSWVWGWDRKICPKDHWLESWGLRSDDKWWSLGDGFFYVILTRIIDSFSCSPLCTAFYIGKTWKRLPGNPEYAEMWHGEIILTIQCCHRLTYSQLATDVRLFGFLSFPRAGTGMWDRIISHG